MARGGSPRPIKSFLTTQDNGVNWIKIGDTDKDGKYISSTKERIIPTGVSKSRMVHKGDFLLTNSMSFGRPYILNIDGCIHDGWLVISPIGNVFDKNFLYLLLSSGYAFNQFRDQASGSAVSNLNSDKVADSLFPLPPIKAQKRIVEEYEKLSIFIQALDTNKDNLKSVLQLAKSKILDLAMQGKLVPQDPTDEPAADMLRRINPKAKIITDNPHSWKIPSGWCITDLKSIGKWQSGATPSRMNPNYYGKGIPWLNTGDLTDGEIYNIPKEITELALKETSVKLNPSGSILIAMYGATIGKLGILTFEATTNQACCACAKCFIFNKFLFHFLKHHRPTFIKIGGGGAQSNISKEKIENTVLYLPPLNEQKRIVAKIEELYSVLNKIEASLQS